MFNLLPLSGTVFCAMALHASICSRVRCCARSAAWLHASIFWCQSVAVNATCSSITKASTLFSGAWVLMRLLLISYAYGLSPSAVSAMKCSSSVSWLLIQLNSFQLVVLQLLVLDLRNLSRVRWSREIRTRGWKSFPFERLRLKWIVCVERMRSPLLIRDL